MAHRHLSPPSAVIEIFNAVSEESLLLDACSHKLMRLLTDRSSPGQPQLARCLGDVDGSQAWLRSCCTPQSKPPAHAQCIGIVTHQNPSCEVHTLFQAYNASPEWGTPLQAHPGWSASWKPHAHAHFDVELLSVADIYFSGFVEILRLHTFCEIWGSEASEDIVISSQSCLFDLHTIVNTIVNINVIVKSSVWSIHAQPIFKMFAM